jgi:hypothetical protein
MKTIKIKKIFTIYYYLKWVQIFFQNKINPIKFLKMQIKILVISIQPT